MNSKTISFTLAAVLLAPMVSQAEEAGQSEPGSGPKVLLLDNDQVAHYDRVEELPDGYRVSRNGGSFVYSKNRVRHIADSIQAVYEFKSRQVPIHDAAERLRLSSWCLSNNLREQAKSELELVLRMDPENSLATRRLKRLLEPETVRSIRGAREEGEERVADPSAVIDTFVRGYGRDAFSQYNKVEKILMNQCASCHGNSRYVGEFRLYSPRGGGGLGQRLTARNLESVRAQIDLKHPENSRLLTRSLTAHGTMQVPAFGGVHDRMYQELEDFVYLMAGKYNRNDTMLAEVRRRRAPEPAGQFGADRPLLQEQMTDAKLRPRPVMPAPGSDVERPGLGAVVADDAPDPPAAQMAPRRQVTKPRTIEDPFDPDAFNKQFGAAPPKKDDAEPKKSSKDGEK